MRLKSERLSFREFDANDYTSFSSVFSNESVMKYAYMNKIDDEEEMISYFNKVIDNTKGNGKLSSCEFAVFLTSTDDFIGFADIIINYHLSNSMYGEIGYFLLPGYWGKGYATEIANTLLNICFTKLQMYKVVASCSHQNSKSENIMKKIGMVKEGQFRKVRYKNGGWDDELRYSILLEEWKEKCVKDL